MERVVRNQQQQRSGGVGGGCRGGGVQSEPEFFLQWGNRKRLRCVKVLVKDDGSEKTTVRVDRRVVRADKDSLLLLRPRPSPHPLLRNSENSSASAMKEGQSNGGTSSVRGVGGASSPERAEARVSNGNAGGSGSSETAHDHSKKGAGSSSGSDATVWPKFTVALSNKEKEEDFWAIKGSKLPQRPKKRSKFIQRTVNLVSPGTWLSDLTLERYEVREKKIAKKRPRGLKAMGNMETDSE